MPKKAAKSFLCKLCDRRVRIPDGWTRGPAVRRHYWSKHRDHMTQANQQRKTS